MGNLSLTDFNQISVGGENKIYTATMNFSTSYAVGGDSVVLSETPFNTKIQKLIVLDNSQSTYQYIPKYNASTGKVLSYTNDVDVLATNHHHSLQTFDEVKAVVANVATATTFPVCINAVYALAGGVTGYMKVIPGDQTPATGECAVVLGGPKTFTFFAGDAVTSAQLNYLYVATTGDDIGSNVFTNYSETAGGTNISAITFNVLLIGS